MIKVEEALKYINEASIKTSPVSIGIKDALNYVLAENITSEVNMPSFKQSAMDGYAVCGSGLKFKIIDEIQAGDTRELSMKIGEACRIFTGAAVPIEATAVVMQEKTEVNGHDLLLEEELKSQQNVRPIGEQVKSGDLVFEAGQKLNAAALGLLVSLGVETVQVYKNPKISLLVTGDELKSLGTNLNYGEIYESNSITLISAAKQSGFEINDFVLVADDFESTKQAISRALKQSDVLLLSGGISVGDYDFVKESLMQNGVEEVFYKVKQKPGKPLFFGRKGDTHIFALPGNPAAALTCFYIYVLPILRKLKGSKNAFLESRMVALGHDYTKRAARSTFLKGLVEDNVATVLDGQSSAMLHSFALSNCLIYLADDQFEVKSGEQVKIYIIPD